MKLMFASDLHGSEYYCKKMWEAYERENAQRFFLLGDLLYHGPRNDLPRDYNPKAVIKLLNDRKEELFCVGGNCDAQVDQMVLEFPILPEYMTVFLEDKLLFLTHGHVYNENNMPKIKTGDVLVYGHTHVCGSKVKDGILCLNPGSVAIPKENTPNSYMVFENDFFVIKDMDGKPVKEQKLSSF